MNKLASTFLILVSIGPNAMLAQTAQNSTSGTGAIRTLTGLISDTMCGATYMDKKKTAAECTRECIKNGSDYALVVGKNVYTLKGDRDQFDKLAGKGAVVRGTVKGSTITVESVHSSKATAKS